MTEMPEVEIVGVQMDSSGLEFRLRHPIVPLIALQLGDAFKAVGGTNYVSFGIDHPDLGPMTLTMRRRDGETPEAVAHHFREALERIASGEKDSDSLARTVLDRVVGK